MRNYSVGTNRIEWAQVNLFVFQSSADERQTRIGDFIAVEFGESPKGAGFTVGLPICDRVRRR
jgi:hypothetical protein